jgi:hypothetical protein
MGIHCKIKGNGVSVVSYALASGDSLASATSARRNENMSNTCDEVERSCEPDVL